MLAEADKANPTVNFNRQYAGSSAVVVNNRDVRGAFTRKGWDFMQAAFKDRGKKYGGEEWVLQSGKYKSEAAVPDNLDQLLRERYTDDYIKTWRNYFNITRVADYSGPADAAAKLLHHSDGRAPILALIGLGSWHTNVDTPKDSPYAEKVRKAFEWARVIVAPAEGAYITDKNRPYTTGLSNLQIAVDAASKSSPPDQASAQATVIRAQDALGQTRAVAAFPGQDTEGRLDQTLMRIMEAPIKSTEGLFSPAKMLNAGGAAMCQQFNVLTNKFPFNPGAQPEVQITELNELLRPGTGKFWQFYEQSLKQFLQKQGASYVPAGGGVTMNPTFVNFFNQVARLSEAFYRGGTDPRLNYTIAVNGVDLLLNNTQARSGSLSVDGKAARIGAGASPFVWAGPHTVLFEYNESPAFNQQGLWAIFRFFVDAEVSTQGSATHLTWPVRGGQGNNRIANARFTVDLQGAPAVFDRNFMRGLRCISTVATK
jgi:type VI secretion system protein ImpL